MSKQFFSLLILSVAFFSCSQYVTPGADVKISALADEDVARLLSNKPASEFPVNLAIARIQSPGYTNYQYRKNFQDQPQANFSMILTRNAQEDEAFARVSEWEGVSQASPFNRLLLPLKYSSIKDLRLAAARMKAGMLLVYTFNTEFIIDTRNYGPQNVFTLGYLKNKDVKVVTTASAALFDVQTEYLYGLAEFTASKNRKANAWKKFDEVDALRIQTEQEAFRKLLSEVEKMWKEVLREYARK